MVNETKTYNGWTNYQTWAVNLWLENDESTQRMWRDRALAVRNMDGSGLWYIDPYMDEDRCRVWQVGDELRDWHEGQLPEIIGFAADLLQQSFQEINWLEIAQALIEG